MPTETPETDSQEGAEPETQEPRRDPWEAVSDLEECDDDDPPPEVDEEPKEFWNEVGDDSEADLVLEFGNSEDGDSGKAWEPVDHEAPAPSLKAPSRRQNLAPPDPLLLPRHKGTELLPGPRTPLPWRAVARVAPLGLADLLCIADPCSSHSELHVADWEWVEERPGGCTIRLHLADDGPALEAETVGPHELALACTVEVADHRLQLRLQVVRSRTSRGIRLGRDVLAGRFLVDAEDDRGSSESRDED